eukprot:TRINITY_DN6815_c1_g1_i4.p2 TRINITY_DN6815_c1_g1~~TRINITY_DN6815_c1_g1_i4.p2  ORF type:complete len:127 (+),score=1.90 TRINITY_DN6815_c1_g1_i4:230-610(+)
MCEPKILIFHHEPKAVILLHVRIRCRAPVVAATPVESGPSEARGMSMGSAKGRAKTCDRVEDARLGKSVRSAIFLTLRLARNLSEARSAGRMRCRSSGSLHRKTETISAAQFMRTPTLPYPYLPSR